MTSRTSLRSSKGTTLTIRCGLLASGSTSTYCKPISSQSKNQPTNVRDSWAGVPLDSGRASIRGCKGNGHDISCKNHALTISAHPVEAPFATFSPRHF